MKAKPFMVFIFAAVLLWLAAGCAKDSPASEVLEAEDLKALQRPGVELSFDSKSSDGAYSTTAAAIYIEVDGTIWWLPLTQEEHDYLMSSTFSDDGTTFDHLRQKFGEYKIEEGVITIDPFAL